MAVKKTIAIVGTGDGAGAAFAKALAGQPYRLLLVSDNIDRAHGLTAEIMQQTPSAEIEVAGCAKDGCWEADSIALAVPAAHTKEVATMIKDVATQKTVMVLSEATDTVAPMVALQPLLPYAHIVYVSLNNSTMQGTLAGDNKEAIAEAASLVSAAGYQPNVAVAFASGQ